MGKYYNVYYVNGGDVVWDEGDSEGYYECAGFKNVLKATNNRKIKIFHINSKEKDLINFKTFVEKKMTNFMI